MLNIHSKPISLRRRSKLTRSNNAWSLTPRISRLLLKEKHWPELKRSNVMLKHTLKRRKDLQITRLISSERKPRRDSTLLQTNRKHWSSRPLLKQTMLAIWRVKEDILRRWQWQMLISLLQNTARSLSVASPVKISSISIQALWKEWIKDENEI